MSSVCTSMESRDGDWVLTYYATSPMLRQGLIECRKTPMYLGWLDNKPCNLVSEWNQLWVYQSVPAYPLFYMVNVSKIKF